MSTSLITPVFGSVQVFAVSREHVYCQQCKCPRKYLIKNAGNVDVVRYLKPHSCDAIHWPYPQFPVCVVCELDLRDQIGRAVSAVTGARLP